MCSTVRRYAEWSNSGGKRELCNKTEVTKRVRLTKPEYNGIWLYEVDPYDVREDWTIGYNKKGTGNSTFEIYNAQEITLIF